MGRKGGWGGGGPEDGTKGWVTATLKLAYGNLGWVAQMELQDG